MLLFFLLCGRYARSRDAAQDPRRRRQSRGVEGRDRASLRSAARSSTCRLAALKAGDRVLVRPGERVPADGVVVSGASEIDDSLVTGETARRKIAAGSTVYAGSVNYSGALTMRVTAAGGARCSTRSSGCWKRPSAPSRATCRSPIAPRGSMRRWCMLTAALTLAGWLLGGASLHDAIITAIAVLIITCPCALALGDSGRAGRGLRRAVPRGVILNAGDAIERLAEIDTVVFDKTGTLTLPEPRVVNAADIDPALARDGGAAGAVEPSSARRWPWRAKRASRAPFDDAVEEPGQGVRAMIDGAEARLGSAAFCGVPIARTCRRSPASVVSHRISRTPASTCGLRHRARALRPDADRDRAGACAIWASICTSCPATATDAVQPVAEALGIPQWHGGLKPADKIAHHRSVEGARPPRADGRRRPQRCAGAGGGACLAVADQRRRPDAGAGRCGVPRRAAWPVLDAVAMARRARALMMQNLWLAVIYNLDRRADRDRRTGDAADRGGGDVRLVDPGDAQCVARGEKHHQRQSS